MYVMELINSLNTNILLQHSRWIMSILMYLILC